MLQKHINSLSLWFFENLLEFKEIEHFISSRIGGFSNPPYESLNLGLHVGDDRKKVLKNRKHLASTLGIPLSNFTYANQVHGANIKIITEELRGKGSVDYKTAIRETDGMVTDVPNICLTILVADCVPILFFDRRKRVIGIVHAGWKGTVLGITKNMVELLKREFGCKPPDIVVGIGPSIGPCCYKVRSKLANRLESTFGKKICVKKGEKRFFNLWEANKKQLIETGIRKKNIEIAKICTFCNFKYFFSSRRDKGKTGRFGAGIMIKH